MVRAKEEFRKSLAEEHRANAIKYAERKLQGQSLQIPCRDCSVEIYYYGKKEQRNAPILFLMHGGGFSSGHAGNEDALCCRLAESMNLCVVSVNYRETPEFPYPAALHDVYDVVLYFSRNAQRFGIDPARILLMGNSAGANLATVVAMTAKKSGDFSVCCQILGYPYLDCATPPKQKKYYEIDFPAAYMEVFNEMYAAPELRRQPDISPIYATRAELDGLPPAVIVLADRDSLSEEGQVYANMLLEAGVEVHVKKFPGVQHGFIEHHFQGLITPEEKAKYTASFEEDAERAVDFIAACVKAVLKNQGKMACEI